jgi:hypothetical protein
LVVAADMRFIGVRFQEVSFSVMVRPPKEGIGRNAAFLVHAFNSRRFFAIWERLFFGTPYYYGNIRVSTTGPCSIRLSRRGKLVFQTEMQAEAASPSREPPHSGDGCWEGPIFLPNRRPGKDGQGKVFFGKLRGQTRTYPFLHGRDSVTIRPLHSCDVFQALIDSHFAVEKWIVREDATHAKSKTYKRSEVFMESSEIPSIPHQH